MQLLLPHRFKTIGAVIAPLGLTLWITMQLGYISNLLVYCFGETADFPAYHNVNVVVAIIAFFSFLAGIYFITFSKEKIEDEMVQRTRLDSFQFAAFIQIAAVVGGFLFMLFTGDPGESRMMFFFIVLVALFWISFIARFNYILHVKLRQ